MSAFPVLFTRSPKPVSEAQQTDDVDLPPIATATDQVVSTVAAKAVSVALVGCLVAGPLGLVVTAVAWGTLAAPASTAPVTVLDQSNERARAGEFAERVVVAWLTATREDAGALTELVPGAQMGAVAQVPFTVTDPAVAGIEYSDGVWSVTVAASVTDDLQRTARRLYQVPVVLGEQAVTALTMPAPVAGVATGSAVRLGYGTQLTTTGQLAEAVVGFLSGYAAGQGDVARYLTPGAPIRAIAPAPFTAVRLEDLRGASRLDEDAVPQDGQVMNVLARVTAQVTPQQSLDASYALVLTARAQRWEITSIDVAPNLADAPAGEQITTDQSLSSSEVATTPTFGPTGSASDS